MEIRVLGPLEVLSEGAVTPVGGPKQRLVLAILVMADGYTVSADSLIDRVWGDAPPGDAKASIHTYISRLRGVFGDRLERVGDGYRLALDKDTVDARLFERLVDEARATTEADPATAGAGLRQALALWRGQPYADLRGEPTLRAELTRLEELRTAAIEARIDADLALGHDAELVGELEVLTAEYPLQERFRYQHMLALYRAGRQAEALRAYQRTRTMLGEELGVEPSPELQDLEDRILRQDPALEHEIAPRVETRALLLTDLESSTVLWELQPAAMTTALAQHDRILNEAVEDAGGRVFKSTGDGICAVFDEVEQAVTAAAVAQRTLAEADWADTGPLTARMAVDVGEVEARGGDYFGPTLNRCARIMSAGHGGQILLSDAAHAALTRSGEPGWEVRTLGEYRFKGLGRPHQVYQLLIEGLRAQFPPLQIDRLPPPLPGTAFGRTVRGYELREQIGGGDFGIVYRAYQPTVGREVAVKVIRPEHVDQPAFVRRFEAEAQLVAQLEHPHIVALYDYWRDPDGAYLVMRWMRGGSLRRALERGPFNQSSAFEVLDHVGGALSYAHRQGVAHRDLKPGNVLLDDEGNAYLSDFGIATRLVDASEAGRPYATSPAYVPPEELRGEPLTLRADIYALGMLTFELFTGHAPPMDGPLPAAHEVRPDLPAALSDVIERAVADDPVQRYATVDEFLISLRLAVGEAAGEEERAFTPTRNPYKGLYPFREGDAVDFFGRDAIVADLVQSLSAHRLVAVVGPSGIGKSSVVRAGLIPALRAGQLPGSRQWLITDMYPGSYPFEELAAAVLRVAAEAPIGLSEELQRDERGLVRATKSLVGVDDTVVLLIDQFEELFTLTRDEDARRRFLECLVTALADERSRLRVVITLRADFFDRPLRYPEFGELLKAGLVAVTALSDDELVSAIEQPALGVGVGLEPGLTEHIVADLHRQPGALPLLQYALTELFSSRHSDLLTVGGYDAAGGVTGALGRRAEDLYAGLAQPGRELCRQLFLRLVSVDEQSETTRRRVRRRELEGLGDADALEQVLKVFGDHRLLSFDRDPVTRGPTVEVAHEALLTEWDRLDDWITEQRESLVMHGRFRAAVDEWEASDRSDDYLLGGGRLAQFEAWAESGQLTLTADERSLLGRSRSAADQDEARRRRMRRFIMGGFAGVAVVALVFAVFALIQQQRAEENADEAQRQEEIARQNERVALDNASEADESRREAERQRGLAQDAAAISQATAAVARVGELTAESATVLESDPELSLLLAREAVVEAQAAAQDGLGDAMAALHQAINTNRLVASFGSEYRHFAFDPTRERIFLFTATHHAVSELDEAGWTEPEPLYWLPGVPQFYIGGSWEAGGIVHPDGDTIVLMRKYLSRQQDPYTALSAWDIESGEQIASTEIEQQVWTAAGNGDVWLGMGSDWASPIPADASAQEVEATLESLPGLDDVAVEGAGTEIDPWIVRFVERSRSIEHLELRLQQQLVVGDPSAEFSLDVRFDLMDEPSWLDVRGDAAQVVGAYAAGRGATVEGSGTEEDPWMFVPREGTVPPVVSLLAEVEGADIEPQSSVLGGGVTSEAWEATYTPDGSRLAVAGFSEEVRILDGHTLSVEGRVPADSLGIRFSPNGSHLAVAGLPWLWNLETNQLESLASEPPAFSNDIAFLSENQLVLAGRAPTYVWDPVSGETLDGTVEDSRALTVDALPGGGLFAVGLANSAIRLYEYDDGYQTSKLLSTLRGHDSSVLSVQFSSSGRYLASVEDGGGVHIWDVTPTGRGELLVSDFDQNHVAFSPDGNLVAATGPNAGLAIWDLESGSMTEVPAFEVPEEEEEELLDEEEEDLEDGEDEEEFSEEEFSEEELALQGKSIVAAAVSSPDGGRLAVSLEPVLEIGPYGTAVLDIATGDWRLVNVDPAWDLAWSADGSRLAASLGSQAIVWDANSYEEVFAAGEEWIASVALSPSGRFLAVKHFGWFALEAYTEIWDVDEGTSIKLTRCGGANGALHFLDEGTLLCAGKDPFGEGSGVGLWDVRTGEEIQPLDAHDGEVFSASASAGGHLIATAGNDGTIVLWDGETFERISTLTYSDGEVFDLELSPDGRRMATTSWAGPIRVWALEAGELLALADTRITRQFTPFECETYDIRSAPCSDVGE